MKTFEAFIKEMKVKKGSPDPIEAQSLFKQSEQRLSDLIMLPLSDSNASFRFESAYEVMREALQAFLALRGFKPYSHEAIFVFCKEHELLSMSEYMKGNRYREIRNDINYRGKTVIKSDAEEIILFVQNLTRNLKTIFDNKISKNERLRKSVPLKKHL
ncbi:MAG: hypothetical protein ABIH34_00120 [Nanoarchaeota archaeon]